MGGADFRTMAPGTPTSGGYFVGIATFSDGDYALIDAGKASEVERIWKTSDTNTSGTNSVTDGLANSNAMNTTAHPAARYCRQYTGGGFSDWYLPSKSELLLEYLNLRSEVTDFQPGGPNAFENAVYWSSTQASDTQAWRQTFATGTQESSAKANNFRIRPMRRVKV